MGMSPNFRCFLSSISNLLEFTQTYPSSPPPSRSGDPPSISGTESGIIDPLVSKRPEKISETNLQIFFSKKIQKNTKNTKNSKKYKKIQKKNKIQKIQKIQKNTKNTKKIQKNT